MAAGGWTYAALAQQVEVDPKSVERWVNLGRIPRRATALQAAKALGEDVHALWPALRQARPARAISPELVALYEQRADIPVSTFTDLMAQARERIDILVYAAVFLHEAYPRLNELLTERAAEGCTVRIAIGDADSDTVQARGQEERFGHGIESRCRLALMHYRPLASTPGIEVRTHETTLYNSSTALTTSNSSTPMSGAPTRTPPLVASSPTRGRRHVRHLCRELRRRVDDSNPVREEG